VVIKHAKRAHFVQCNFQLESKHAKRAHFVQCNFQLESKHAKRAHFVQCNFQLVTRSNHLTEISYSDIIHSLGAV